MRAVARGVPWGRDETAGVTFRTVLRREGAAIGGGEEVLCSLAGELRRIVLYNDRHPRSGETDGVEYHFRAPEKILALGRGSDFVVLEVRPGNFQALGNQDIEDALRMPGRPFLEAFYKFGDEIGERKWLKGEEILSVFLSPLTKEEILLFRERGSGKLEDFVCEVMSRKLFRRAQRQKGLVSARVLEDIETRAGTAYDELRAACRYDYVIPNHDGEDSENWDEFYYPIGDARRALLSFIDILEGREPRYSEKWPPDLVA